MFTQNDKVEELERLIRQSERERLLLEKQIQSPIQSRITSPLHSEEIGDLQQKLGIMEDENENLKTSVKKLEKVEEESIRLVCTQGEGEGYSTSVWLEMTHQGGLQEIQC